MATFQLEPVTLKLDKKVRKWPPRPSRRSESATFAGPGAKPVIETVPWPKIDAKAALIKIGACGVCGTDQHILKGHWPKPLPWPFTLGHELGGVIVEKGRI